MVEKPSVYYFIVGFKPKKPEFAVWWCQYRSREGNRFIVGFNYVIKRAPEVNLPE